MKISYWVFPMLLLIVMITGMEAWADDRKPQCPQDRKTPQAPADVYNMKNPLPANPANIKEGEELFHKKVMPLKCKLCHGDKGDGLGDPDFASTPAARNFTCSATMKDIPDGQLFWIIKKGSPGTSMPPFGNLKDDAVWKLVTYIRTLAK